MIPTRILYTDRVNNKLDEWTGELPLLHRGMCLALPKCAATRVTDVKLVLTSNGIFEQVIFTGLMEVI